MHLKIRIMTGWFKYLSISLFLAVITEVGAQDATLILKNARICTMDESRPRAEAVAMGCDRTRKVGTDAEVSLTQLLTRRLIKEN